MESLIQKHLTPFEIKCNTVSMQIKIAEHREKKSKPFVNKLAGKVERMIPKRSADEIFEMRRKEKQQKEEGEKQKIYKAWCVFKVHMPVKFHRAKLEAIKINGVYSPNQVRVISEFKGKGIADKPKNTLFVGSSGIGKTHFSSALGIRYIYQGLSCRFVQDDQYVRFLKEDANYAKQFETCDVLVLDDIAGDGDYGRIATWQSKEIRNLIYNRADRGLATIISTNFTKEQLHKYLGHRVWSRFTSDWAEGERFCFVDFGSKSGLRGVA